MQRILMRGQADWDQVALALTHRDVAVAIDREKKISPATYDLVVMAVAQNEVTDCPALDAANIRDIVAPQQRAELIVLLPTFGYEPVDYQAEVIREDLGRAKVTVCGSERELAACLVQRLAGDSRSAAVA